MNWLKIFIVSYLCFYPFAIQASKHHHARDKHSKKEQASNERKLQEVNQQISAINNLIKEINNAKDKRLLEQLSLYKLLHDRCAKSIRIFSEFNDSLKSQKKNTSHWRNDALEYCNRELPKLRDLYTNNIESIHQLEIAIAVNNCQQKYTEGVDIRDKVEKNFTDTNEVVQTLNKASATLQQALPAGKNAFALMQDEQRKTSWLQFLGHIEKLSNECRQQAQEWPNFVSRQKVQLNDEISCLQTESIRLENEGLNHKSREALEQVANRFTYLIGSGVVIEKDAHNIINDKLEQSKDRLSAQLIELCEPFLTFEEFKKRENVRREDFYQNLPRKTVIPATAVLLDGQTDILYVDHNYRYLVQRDSFPHKIDIKVSQEGQILHEETLSIPSLENCDSPFSYQCPAA